MVCSNWDSSWPKRLYRTGDIVCGRMAKRCKTLIAGRWVSAKSRTEVEAYAARRGIDPRLAAHLPPPERFDEDPAYITFESVASWMEWVSARPEPDRTTLIEAFEFYLAWGGDAPYRVDIEDQRK